MTAEEFERRMAEHQRQADEDRARLERLRTLTNATWDMYDCVKIAGCRLIRWRVTPEQADQMDQLLGGHDTLLGYPVVVSR